MQKAYWNIKYGNPKTKLLSLLICIYLVFGFLSNIFWNYNPRWLFSRTIFTFFLLFEIFYVYQLQELAIQNRKLKYIYRFLLIISVPYILKLFFIKYYHDVYNILFLFESLVAVTISMTYFLELSATITRNNVMDDPITILMMGLFFCFGMPLSLSSSVMSLNFINPNYYNNLKFIDKIIFITVSHVGTLCYVIFNLFIIKAFKCKQTIHTGYH